MESKPINSAKLTEENLKNTQNEDLTVEICEVCGLPHCEGCESGYYHYERDGYRSSAECPNKKQKDFKGRCWRMLKSAGIPEPYLKKTFEQFNPAGNEDIFDIVKAWSEKPEGWIFLHGDIGTGKTHLSCAAMQVAILNGKKVYAASLPDVLWEVQQTNHESRKLMQNLMDIPILGLDDLGAHRDTTFAIEVVFRILNRRYMAALPTIITSNWMLKDMVNMGIDWKRIADRIVEMTKPNRTLKLKGESRR